MNKRIRMSMAACMLAAVMLIITACGSKPFDASGYVKSFMDMLTKGEVEEYMKFTGETEEEAMEDYNAMTNAMMEAVGAAGVSKEVQERFKDVYVKILAKSKYTVGEAQTTDNGFKVDVTIEPITGLYDGLSDELQQEASDYATELISSGKEVEQAAVTDWIFNRMLDKMEERLETLSYGEPTVITVEIEKDKDDNKYEIKDEEAVGEKIGAALIDTSALE